MPPLVRSTGQQGAHCWDTHLPTLQPHPLLLCLCHNRTLVPAAGRCVRLQYVCAEHQHAQHDSTGRVQISDLSQGAHRVWPWLNFIDTQLVAFSLLNYQCLQARTLSDQSSQHR